MAGQFDRHPFLLAPNDVAAALTTDVDKGLNSAQVAQLQQEYPRNELDIGGAIPWYTIFIKQLFNAMILVCSRPQKYHKVLSLLAIGSPLIYI